MVVVCEGVKIPPTEGIGVPGGTGILGPSNVRRFPMDGEKTTHKGTVEWAPLELKKGAFYTYHDNRAFTNGEHSKAAHDDPAILEGALASPPIITVVAETKCKGAADVTAAVNKVGPLIHKVKAHTDRIGDGDSVVRVGVDPATGDESGLA